MAVEHTCPICGSKMFHDKGNHITFCGKCDHVGWPHDAMGTKIDKPEEKPSDKNES